MSSRKYLSRSAGLLQNAVKLVILILLAGSLYQQVFARSDVGALWAAFRAQFTLENAPWLIAVVILMPVNWGFETLKWRALLRHFSALSLLQTYRAVLSGVTVSLFTPNRIGEYGGRLLLIPAEYSWKAVLASLVGSYSQLIALWSGGVTGALVFFVHFSSRDPSFYLNFVLLGAGVLGGMLVGFFNMDWFQALFRRLPWPKKWHTYLTHLEMLRSYNRKVLLEALTYAFLRYLTYCLQYVLILEFFEVGAPPGLAFAGAAGIFLIQTSIPFPPLMSLLARGEIALLIWGHFTVNNILILGASFGLFIINLSIPSLLGAIMIVKTNMFKPLGYEKYTS